VARKSRLVTGEQINAAYEAHIDRLHAELRYLPCSTECANVAALRLPAQTAGPGLAPGRCAPNAHDREHLGLGGRRVLVSRKCSGQTLTEHSAD
jgi:hypothetical protein